MSTLKVFALVALVTMMFSCAHKAAVALPPPPLTVFVRFCTTFPDGHTLCEEKTGPDRPWVASVCVPKAGSGKPGSHGSARTRSSNNTDPPFSFRFMLRNIPALLRAMDLSRLLFKPPLAPALSKACFEHLDPLKKNLG